ncbi:hypothetical protein WN48_01087 [Eufriesea mexicana]|nr:hypothetical protein WN48_01087 [Eufriesea mexicana]
MHTGGHIPPALGTCIQCYVSIYISQPMPRLVYVYVSTVTEYSPTRARSDTDECRVYLRSHRYIYDAFVRLGNEREKSQKEKGKCPTGTCTAGDSSRWRQYLAISSNPAR